MREYRAYILGIDGHRFVWAKDFATDHPDDATALDAAKLLTDKHPVEVWDDGRLVAQLSPVAEGVSPELVPSLAFAAISEVVLTASPEKAHAMPGK